MTDEFTQKLNEVVLAAVKQQIKEKNPQETCDTFERLLEEGFSEEDSLKMICHVVSLETLAILSDDYSFDRERFAAALDNLPGSFFKK